MTTVELLVVHLYLGNALLLFPFALENFETPKAWLLVLLVGLLAPGLLTRATARPIIPWGFHLPLAMLALSTLASSWWALDSQLAWVGNPKAPLGALQVAALALLWLVLRQQPVESRRLALAAALVGGALNAAYAVVQATGHDPMAGHWENPLYVDHVNRPTGLLGHANFLAFYLVLLWPVLWTDFIGWRPVRWALQALFAAAIIACAARGAWAAWLASSALWLVMRPPSRRAVALGAAGAIALGGSAAVWLAHHDAAYLAMVAGRLPNLRPSPERFAYWRGAWRLFRERPLLGWGVDGFEAAFLHVRDAAYWYQEPGGQPHRAHCDLLNLLACQGLAGLAAYACLLLVFVRRYSACFRSVTRASNAPWDLQLALCSLVAWSVNGLAGFSTVSGLVLLVLLLCLPASSSLLSGSGQASPTPSCL